MAPSIDTPVAPPAPATFAPSQLGETPLLVEYSARVKAVDVHPTEPWVLSALYDGTVVVHDVATGSVVKSFRVSASPVRAAKFIPRMNWVATGSDDRRVRVFRFDTNELVVDFEAHEDYVRGLDVHPTLPLLFSCGDDHLVKAWDWTKNWVCERQLVGHRHYAMSVAVSQSGTTIATASLDHDVRLWRVEALESQPGDAAETATSLALAIGEIGAFAAHARGLNAVAFDAAATRLVSASDDYTVRVWDVATQRELAVLNGHTGNVTSVLVHATLPLIVSGAEDGTVRLWSSESFRCVGVFAHGLGRAWALGTATNRNALAIGYDRGTVVVALPAAITNAVASRTVDHEGYVAVTHA